MNSASWYIGFVLLAAGSLPAESLRECVDRGDTACVARSLAPTPPGCADCLELNARAYLLLGRKQEALAAIAAALRIQPDEYRYSMTQGRIEQKLGDQVRAIECFLTADRIRPRVPETYYYLGMSFVMIHEYARARKHFDDVLALSAKHDKAEFMLAILDEFDNRIPESRAHFENALRAQPRNPFYHLHYGILLGQFAGDPESGMREMKTAETLDPNYGFTRYCLGRLYRQAGKLDAARAELEAAVKLQPGLAEAWYQLASVYRQLNLPDQSSAALRSFQHAREQEQAHSADPVESAILEREPRNRSAP